MPEPADGWIRVTERKPETLENVWIYGPQGGVEEGHLGFSELWFYGRGGVSRDDVTHWMLIQVPAPPKETTHAR
jgi:hypothetical protein